MSTIALCITTNLTAERNTRLDDHTVTLVSKKSENMAKTKQQRFVELFDMLELGEIININNHVFGKIVDVDQDNVGLAFGDYPHHGKHETFKLAGFERSLG
ncbi:MAG: hypothetical protein JRN15_06650 [Nitrososphaerota archaeon]|nr:hypothetical protein [Nitrososphaerota archaeon]